MGNEEVDTGYEDEGDAVITTNMPNVDVSNVDMPDINKQKILSEIIDILLPEPRREDEFTVDDFMAELKNENKVLTRRRAYGLLMKAKEDGIITGRKIPIDGMLSWVFRLE